MIEGIIEEKDFSRFDDNISHRKEVSIDNSLNTIPNSSSKSRYDWTDCVESQKQ
ncbi:Uncharacterised protein [Streptococcus pneumoniae]|nr:Uncharacterised protein [Streptococcus pneumoniae]